MLKVDVICSAYAYAIKYLETMGSLERIRTLALKPRYTRETRMSEEATLKLRSDFVKEGVFGDLLELTEMLIFAADGFSDLASELAEATCLCFRDGTDDTMELLVADIKSTQGIINDNYWLLTIYVLRCGVLLTTD